MKTLNLTINKTYFQIIESLGIKDRNPIEGYSKFEYFQKRIIDYTTSILLMMVAVFPRYYLLFRLKGVPGLSWFTK